MKILTTQNEYCTDQTLTQALKTLGYTPLDPVLDYNEAIISIEKNQPQLGIFDIELKGEKTGIELAKVVNEDYQFPFIFLTSETDKEVINLMKLTNPFAIVIKPFHLDELYAALELAIHRYALRKETQSHLNNSINYNSLFIKQKDGHIRISYKDILYIKSDGVYLDIFTTENKTYIIRSTIDSFTQKLNPDFFKIHRSYVVNTLHIEKIIDFEYIKILDNNIPIGRKYKAQFMELINLK